MFRIDRNSVSTDKTQQAHIMMMPSALQKLQEAQALAEANAQAAAAAMEGDIVDEPQEPEEPAEPPEAQAEAILNDGRKQADEMVQLAQIEADQIKKSAYDEGYKTALIEAQQDIAAERRAQDEALKAMLKEIGRARGEMLSGIEGDVLDLCMDITRKIIPTVLNDNDDAFMALVRNAIGHMKSEGKITIRVHPLMYERYFAAGSAFFAMDSKSISVSVVEDPAMEPFGMVAESDGETINASVESQLKNIEIAFKSDSSVV